MTVNLTLVCMLQMVAGEGWAGELQRGALVRKDHGEPSVFSTIADNVIEVSRSAWERGTETFASWAQSSWVPSSAEEPASGRSTPLADVGPNGHVPAPLADVGAHGRAPAPRGNAERKKARAIPPLPQPPSGFAPLSPGFGTPPWRLLSVPDEPDNVDPAALLPTVASDFTLAYAYDACDPVSPWRVYDPADLPGSDLTAVDHRIGFWLKGPDPDPLAVSGTEPAETSIRLCTGWNLIGYPLAQDRPVLAALSSIIGKFLRVYGFDPNDEIEPWKVYDVDVPDWANTLRVMERGQGYWIYAVEETTLVMRNAGPVPEVEITSPEDGAAITFLTEVLGTVRSDLLERWELSYRSIGETAWTAFATGDTPVIESFLGTFDPTLLLNGLYEIRLQAVDFGGHSTMVAIAVAVEGAAKIGNFTLTYTDFDVPVSGLPIQVFRTYDSRDKGVGDFGVGWTLELSDVQLQENRTPGDDWQGTRTGLVIPVYCVQPTERHIVTITLPDDSVLRFRPVPTPDCQIAIPPQVVTVNYEPLPGTVGSLRPLGRSEEALVVGSFPGPVQLWDFATTTLHDPAVYELTTRDGRILVIDQDAGLSSITDPNGNKLTVSDRGITHSSGKGLTFERDDEGRIVKITDPLGRFMTYDYDAAGDLVTVTDRDESTSRFTYDSAHLLLDVKDPRGIRSIRNDYDTDGRLLRHTDAFGKIIEYTHDLAASQEIVTDRLGHSRLFEYDARGNVVREVDQAGHETLRTFDGQDNLLSETNSLGHTTTYTYTAGNDLASIRDPLGNTTTFTYDSSGRLLTERDPRGKATSNTYDAAGNLLTTTDALGHEASFTYDGQGNRLTATDPTGAVTTYVYDRHGNLASMSDALSTETAYTYDGNGNRLTETTSRTLPNGSTETQVWTFAYDADGRQVTSTDPTGAVTTILYNAFGQVTGEIDALGRLTKSTYDGLGRLVQTDHPDGSVESRTYDAEGHVISTIDRGGRETTYEYDSVGRLIEIHFPDGAIRSQTYDAASRLISTTDERGNVTTFVYDAAGFRTMVINALGQVTVFVRDTAGNVINTTNANGHTTSFTYDDLNRLVTTTFPDGSTSSTAYDAAGRRLGVTDQAGGTTMFAYDALGRLISVTDALGQVTSYAWDEQGNLVSQTDANGHTTRFEHDALRRQTAQVLPDGAREVMAYDAAGNRVSHTDFQGRTTTWAYDAADRPVTKTLPGGATVTYTYTYTGRRASVTDSRGTTSYAYDSRDRLIEMVYPDGRRLTYAYDLAGNRTSLTAHLAGGATISTSYTWDELNRLDTVVDAAGRIYDHGYDAAGNRAALDYPNGVRITYQYDALNRLIHLASEHTASATTVASFAYTLGPTGNRTRIDEHDGNVRVYGYDALYRLTSEEVTAGTNLLYRNTFGYDPVGNRLEQYRTAADGTTTTARSTYDDRDRLLTANGTSYAWDANGNLTARGADDFGWNVENRLVEAILEDGTTVRQTYDADGVRVRTETTEPSTGETVTVDYLVDTSGPLSQVEAETEGDTGLLLRYYVRGDDLLAIVRPTGIRYYHADGFGNIRALTDETGAVTDRYQFEAFGMLLEHVGDDPNAYLFAGEPLDPNIGFAYHRARWMDPAAGRFVSPDPLFGSPFDPRSLHRYNYAFDDPINVRDPSGEQSLLGFAFTQGIIGALISFVITYAFTRNLKKSLYSALGGFVVGFFVGGAFYWLRGLLAARSAATAVAAAGAADDVVIAADKLRYLLQLDPGKAKGFAELGYTLENADDLANILRYSRTLIGEGTTKTVTEFGTKYEVVMKVIGANGREGLIEVVWQVDRGTSLYRLITSIPKPF